MGIFDKFDKKNDKPPESKPDFSNVRSGGSSTAPAVPQPTSTIGLGKTTWSSKGTVSRKSPSGSMGTPTSGGRSTRLIKTSSVIQI